MAIWFLVPFAYLLGSLSTAVIVSKLAGLPDPREQGSKNPGATNVLRLGGKGARCRRRDQRQQQEGFRTSGNGTHADTP